MFIDFFKYTFLGKIVLEKPDAIIETIEAEPPDRVLRTRDEYLNLEETRTRSKIVISINIILGIICLSSFFFIIFYLLVNTDKAIPEIIQNTFFTTLGYFGSAFISFTEKQSK
jgi:hypothetical protein